MSMRKNKKGHWEIGIQSLGLNTTLSTKTGKKVDAARIERQVQTRVDQVKLDGTHPFHKWTKAEQRAWIKTGREPKVDRDAPVTVARAITGYLDFVGVQNLAFNTTEGYRRDLDFARKKFGSMPLESVTARHLQEWVHELAKTVITSGSNRGQKLGVKTQRVKVGALKRAVRYYQGLGEERLNDRIFDSVRYGVEQPRLLNELSPWVDFETRAEELSKLGIDQSHENAFKKIVLTEQQQLDQLSYLRTKLLDDGTLPSIRLFAAIFLCCATGARRSEIVRIRRQDLCLDGKLPEVTLLKRKGRKLEDLTRQKTILPDKLVPILKRHLLLHPKDQQCLFTSDDDHLAVHGFDQKAERTKADYFGKLLANAFKGSKWEHAAGWHIYRHTIASRMFEAGYSQIEVKEQIGWSSDEMAEKYQHQSISRKSEIVNKLF